VIGAGNELSQTTSKATYDVNLGKLGAKLEIARGENEANVAIVEHTLPPHTLAAPLHRHSREDEISYVLDGQLTVLAGDEIWTVPAGEATVKGRGLWHTFCLDRYKARISSTINRLQP
jgi:quercetin dioxygenase-like cupin family protein